MVERLPGGASARDEPMADRHPVQPSRPQQNFVFAATVGCFACNLRSHVDGYGMALRSVISDHSSFVAAV